MAVLAPSTLRAFKRRSYSTLVRTTPPQTVANVLSHKGAGLCASSSQFKQTPMIHLYFDLLYSKTSFDSAFRLASCSPFLQADIKVRTVAAFSIMIFLSSMTTLLTVPQVFLKSNSFAKFTPRAVARIMHGISSPAFPSATWSKNHFWSLPATSLPLMYIFFLATSLCISQAGILVGRGRYLEVDFPVVMEAAKAELVKLVGKGE